MANIAANKVISGTFGQVWVDDELIAECHGLQAKVEMQKEDIKLAGTLMTDSKVISAKGKGSLKMFHVTTRFADKISKMLKEGRDVRYTIVSKLADPDAFGAERVVVSNVSFDDLTLADWETGKSGDIAAPFTFTGFDYLDKIDTTF